MAPDDLAHLLTELEEIGKICRLRDRITLGEAERLIRAQHEQITTLQNDLDKALTQLHVLKGKP